jgi:parallel beta-helix repeat protein
MKTICQLSICIVLFTTISFADILNVPSVQYPTIQAGIDSAFTGDTVLVTENTYYENINFKGKAIIVASEFITDSDTSHISKTIIDGSQSSISDTGSVVLFVSGEDTNSVLYGLTITGGTGTILPEFDERGGGGILINASGGRVSYNKIIKNSLTYRGVVGAGIFAGTEENQYVIIEENFIDSNTSITTQEWAEGGGIGIDQGGVTRVINNKITNNSLVVQGEGFTLGAGIISWAKWGLLKGRSLIKGNVIKNNICQPSTDRNWNRGAGLYLEDSNVQLVNNKIIHNYFIDNFGRGGGIYIWKSAAEIINNVLSENFARDGGGIYIRDTDSVQVINNTIIGNTAENGCGIYTQDSEFLVMNTILWNDFLQNWTNEIFYSNTGSIWDMYKVNIYNSIVRDGNWRNIDNSVFALDPLVSESTYDLSDDSPCIGIGRSAIEFNGKIYDAPARDLYDNLRPNSIDTLIDIGAIESPYQPSLVYPKSLGIDKSYVEPGLDLIQFTSNLFNPENHTVNIFSRITSIDSSVTDSIELYDDGNHNDGQADDGLYGGMLDPVMEEHTFHLGIGIKDNNVGSYYVFNDSKRITSIGPVVFDHYRITSVLGSFTLIKIALRNDGSMATADNVTAEITAFDTSKVTDILTTTEGAIDIGVGQVVETDQDFRITTTGTFDTLNFNIKIYSNGYHLWSYDIITALEKEDEQIPKTYSLSQNYPNPFNPSTSIEFSLPKSEYVELKVFNILGEKVTTLVSDKLQSGSHTFQFDGSDLASGIYLYRIEAGEFQDVKKMVLIR